MKALLALALACAALLPSKAHALRVSLVGLGQSTSVESRNDNDGSKTSLGGGALVEFRLVPTLGIEFGLLSAPRAYKTGAGAATFDVKQSGFQVPVVLRAHLANLLSLGVGGYYTKYTGNVEYSNGSGGAYPSTSYDAAGFSSSDYGLVTSLGLYSSLTPGMRILFDARYLIGSKNNFENSSAEKKFRDIQLLLGLQLGF